jgi:hypothetical protein
MYMISPWITKLSPVCKCIYIYEYISFTVIITIGYMNINISIYVMTDSFILIDMNFSYKMYNSKSYPYLYPHTFINRMSTEGVRENRALLNKLKLNQKKVSGILIIRQQTIKWILNVSYIYIHIYVLYVYVHIYTYVCMHVYT